MFLFSLSLSLSLSVWSTGSYLILPTKKVLIDAKVLVLDVLMENCSWIDMVLVQAGASILELYLLVCMNRLELREQSSYNFNTIMKGGMFSLDIVLCSTNMGYRARLLELILSFMQNTKAFMIAIKHRTAMRKMFVCWCVWYSILRIGCRYSFPEESYDPDVSGCGCCLLIHPHCTWSSYPLWSRLWIKWSLSWTGNANMSSLCNFGRLLNRFK